ncbi:hypothetical protein BDA96_03G065800 [Sorghum bicolor]|uniref:Myb-like domain-containing protein n=1 Tax=Sorghum bicolor TaxID=4558 RepID=A0A921RBC2_SORBI|nr:hypothetical protein BDA96_03G065800 [Sorghum bicolor]
MDPAYRGYMNILKQGSSSQHSGSSTQDSPPQIHSTFPQAHPTHSSQSLSPNFHNFHPFGQPANYQVYGNSPPSFLGFQQQGNWQQSIPISFQGFQQQESWGYSPNQVVGSPSSHGSESASPCPATQEKNFIAVEDSSGGEEENLIQEAGGREEGGRRGVRLNWTEEENIRLLSAWVNNSVDPIDGNDKKFDHYWRAVTAEFNSNTPSNDRKRTVVQCKSHWKGVKKEVTKWCGVYSQVTSTWRSGESDDMIIQRAHAWFKSQNNEKPFTLEYMWKDLKGLPKWQRIVEEENTNSKRTKISESGAYTSSSNQDTEDESRHKEKHFVLFNEAIKVKAAAMQKWTEVASESTKAKQSQTRRDLYQTYAKLVDKDTSNFTEKQLKRHEDILEKLAQEISEA